MPACDLFMPTKEQYAEAIAERDRLRVVARAARSFLDAYDRTGGLANTQEQAMALDHDLDGLKVRLPGCEDLVDPYWMA